jgi:hypothetical protein
LFRRGGASAADWKSSPMNLARPETIGLEAAAHRRLRYKPRKPRLAIETGAS